MIPLYVEEGKRPRLPVGSWVVEVDGIFKPRFDEDAGRVEDTRKRRMSESAGYEYIFYEPKLSQSSTKHQRSYFSTGQITYTLFHNFLWRRLDRAS